MDNMGEQYFVLSHYNGIIDTVSHGVTCGRFAVNGTFEQIHQTQHQHILFIIRFFLKNVFANSYWLGLQCQIYIAYTSSAIFHLIIKFWINIISFACAFLYAFENGYVIKHLYATDQAINDSFSSVTCGFC